MDQLAILCGVLTTVAPATDWETYGWISRYFGQGVELGQPACDEINDGLTQAVKADPALSDALAALALIGLRRM